MLPLGGGRGAIVAKIAPSMPLRIHVCGYHTSGSPNKMRRACEMSGDCEWLMSQPGNMAHNGAKRADIWTFATMFSMYYPLGSGALVAHPEVSEVCHLTGCMLAWAVGGNYKVQPFSTPVV